MRQWQLLTSEADVVASSDGWQGCGVVGGGQCGLLPAVTASEAKTRQGRLCSRYFQEAAA